MAGLAVLAGLGLSQAAAGAATIHVSTTGADENDGLSWGSAKRTVAAGLAAAASGDQVWVAVGTYTECITLPAEVGLYGGFAGTETDLTQRDWAAHAAVLDGNYVGSVVRVIPGATAGTRIDGFTICKGRGTSSGSYTYGGGIYCVGASPTIAHNTIVAKYGPVQGPDYTVSVSYGAGIYCGVDASPTISDNVIEGNQGLYGAGIYCSSASPAISRNVIVGNTASAGGGGIYCNSGSPTITGNMISANTGSGVHCSSGFATVVGNTIKGNIGSFGGGIWSSAGRHTISSNAIMGNIAKSGGGGIFCSGSSNATISNNTVTNNSAFSLGGGGIFCTSSLPVISNNVVAFNLSGILRTSGTPTLANNCVYNPDGYNYSGLNAGTGDISVDPQLVAMDRGQIHLAAGSPCIDAGADAAAPAGAVDMDGEARIQGAHVDIGADEFNGTSPPFEVAVVRVSPSGDDAHDGSNWDLAKRTVQAGIDAVTVTAAGGEVWVAAGEYNERINLSAFAHVYGGFAGTENRRDDRNWTDRATILDGGAGGSVVTVSAGYRVSRIDGFTIRNGKAATGGGICCSWSSPIIANNVITGNTTEGEPGAVHSYGGGVYCEGSWPIIENNSITGNVANSDYGSALGGGIYCTNASPTIASNTISRNVAGPAKGADGSGGGVYCVDSSPAILNNRIRENAAVSLNCRGGGLCFSGGSPVVANNTIAANTAVSHDHMWSGDSGRGGGVYYYQSSLTFSNNTLIGNTADEGSGVYCDGGTTVLWNNLVAHNWSGIYQAAGATPTLHNNCVYNPAGYNYSGLNPGVGDISAEPQLVAVEFGEFHLAAGSPCIEAGDDTGVRVGWVDLDGTPRVQGAHVDIGADEFNGTPPPFVPAVIRVSASGSDNNNGSSWALAKKTVQAGIDAASAVGGEVWVAAGTYYEQISLKPWAHMYGGFAGSENTRDQRNWTSHATVLDGGGGRVVVSALPGSGFCRVDGFTIRKGGRGVIGGGPEGGGVECSGAWPVISNNTITENLNAGIDCAPASPVISNNRIVANTVVGINIEGGAPVISNNAITRNELYGVFCSGLQQEKMNDRVPTITNNAITGSREVGICGYSALLIANNIVAFNQSGIHVYAQGVTLRNNCVHNPGGSNYVETSPGEGDIDLDPRFVRNAGPGADGVWGTADDDCGDLRLRAGSPCIDAGNNAAAVAAGIATDLDGRRRFMDDPATGDCSFVPGVCGTAPIVDMGAYEFIPGDYDWDGDVDLDDLAGLQGCLSGPAVVFAGDCLKADFDRDGDVDQEDFGVFQRCFGGAGREAGC